MNFLSKGGPSADAVDWGAVVSNQTLQVLLVVVAAIVLHRIIVLGMKFTLILLGGILAILIVKYVVPWSAVVAIAAASIEYVLQPFFLGRSLECTVRGVLSAGISVGILAFQNSFILAMTVYFFRNREKESIKAAVILASGLTGILFFAGCII